jgi:hypothetical protein
MIPSVPDVLDSRQGQPVVRLATPADAQHLVAFNLAMAWETEHKRLDPEVLGRGVAAVFEQPARGRYWVARRVARCRAACMVTYEWSDWRDGDWWWIQSVYVRPEARGKACSGRSTGTSRRSRGPSRAWSASGCTSNGAT